MQETVFKKIGHIWHLFKIDNSIKEYIFYNSNIIKYSNIIFYNSKIIKYHMKLTVVLVDLKLQKIFIKCIIYHSSHLSQDITDYAIIKLSILKRCQVIKFKLYRKREKWFLSNYLDQRHQNLHKHFIDDLFIITGCGNHFWYLS